MKAPTITLLGPKRLWIIIVNIIIIIVVVVVVVVAVRIPQNWAEPEECGRRRANIGWSEPRLPNSLKPLQVSKCVTITEAQAAAETHPGFRRDSSQNCFCYWCASVAVGVTVCFQCCRYMRPLKARNPAHNAVVFPHTNKDHTDLQSRHWIHSGGSLSSCEVSSICCA